MLQALFALRDANNEPIAAKLLDTADKKAILKHLLDALDVGVEMLHATVAGAISAVVDDNGHDEEFTEHVDQVIQNVIDVKLQEKHAKNATQRAGYVLMLGELSAGVYTRRWHGPILETALLLCRMSGDKAPEVRRNAAQAVHALTVHSLEKNSLDAAAWKTTFGALMTAVGDYSKDNRGQVGAVHVSLMFQL